MLIDIFRGEWPPFPKKLVVLPPMSPKPMSNGSVKMRPPKNLLCARLEDDPGRLDAMTWLDGAMDRGVVGNSCSFSRMEVMLDEDVVMRPKDEPDPGRRCIASTTPATPR